MVMKMTEIKSHKTTGCTYESTNKADYFSSEIIPDDVDCDKIPSVKTLKKYTE